MARVCCRLVVRGLVQGVGYRYSCRREADRLGVAGWVRNRRDGAVEVVAQGEPAAVNALVEWCRRGPVHARVDQISVVAEPLRNDDGFRVRL